ncbi:MAG: aminotransferase class I/II-fold pyridoxal phosphate-dependent enzyme [Thermodesulfobacteriota bacterium]|nr:aminotransferase class I/II-fold pyridoxal phosphate-dependent enzyme [Thermodesulfobacteriota bacterium]
MGGVEFEFIREAFESNYIAPVGPQVDAFEEEFSEKVGIPHAVAVSSGTAAMHLAMQLLGVGPGDEVMASTLTFIGSVTPIVFQGATPVFIDADRTSWNMDPNFLAEELEKCDKAGHLPKAVVPTDLYGQCADMERILKICEPYGIPAVVDAAEAIGAKRRVEAQGSRLRAQGSEFNVDEKWVHAGAGAKAAVFSFNGNKIITTSGGGMLASHDKEFIERARFLSQQARDAAPHYEHSTIGYNYRMSNVLAAIGRGQLLVLDDRVEAKRKIFDIYKEALKDLAGIEFMPEAPYGRSNRWLTVILITPEAFGADRETVRLALEAENIESRPVWKPMHCQPVFQVEGQSRKLKGESKCHSAYRARVVGGAVAEDLFDRGLCLPSGTAMTSSDLERVIGVIRKCCKFS